MESEFGLGSLGNLQIQDGDSGEWHSVGLDMMKSRDEVIKGLLAKVLGSRWTMDDIKGAGGIKIYPDGRERFYLNGKALVEFDKPVVTVDAKKVLSFTQNWRPLWKVSAEELAEMDENLAIERAHAMFGITEEGNHDD